MIFGTQSESEGLERNIQAKKIKLEDILHITHDIQQLLDRFQGIKHTLLSIPRPIDWSRHERQFDTVHPAFRWNILQRADNLSTEEIMIATLLRMEISIPDIARILAVSERATQRLRASLRAKLGIPKGRNELGLLKEL